MAKSEQQRQKKLAKKKAKDKQKHREIAKRSQTMSSLSGQMQWGSRYPFHSCLVSDGRSGLTTVFLARKASHGQLAMAFILVDTNCLGVKNAGGRLCSISEFEEMVEGGARNQRLVPREPAYAKKLVDGAINYAASFGFLPHADYRKVAPLWGDVNADECAEEFQFGVDGKPSYFPGPFEDQAQQLLILNRLRETAGDGNFHFTVTNINDEQGMWRLDSPDYEDDDFED